MFRAIFMDSQTSDKHRGALQGDIAATLDLMLARNTASSMIISAVNVTVATIVLLGSVHGPTLAAWLFLMMAVLLARRIYCRRLLDRGGPVGERAILLLTVASVFAGAGWGVMPFLVAADAPETAIHVAVFMIAGMTAGASLSYASHVKIARAFNLSAIGPLAVYYAVAAGGAHMAMSGVLAMYFLATDMLARRSNQNLTSALESEARAEAQRSRIVNQNTALEALAENYKAAAARAETADANLGRRSAELSLIFDNVPVQLWFKDDQNRILRINKAAADFLGISTREAAGAEAADLFPETAEKFHQDDLAVIRSGKGRFGVIEEYAQASGVRGWARIDKVPYKDPQTGKDYVFVASTDVTDLRKMQEELQRSNEELAQFARVASHDLQEPLKRLADISGRLKETAADALPAEARRDFEEMISTADQMRRLVGSVLELACVQGGEIDLQPVCPSDCIDAALAQLGVDDTQRDRVFSFAPMPDVMAEPRLLTRIYFNLIANALKFSSKNPQPEILFGATRANDNVVLHVQDNGVGVDPACAEEIFEPLVRAHDRDAFEGAGIGLSVCKRGVERLGGRIWVEPATDGGAVFKVELPAANAAAAAA